jgi:hypothetical protein
MKWMAGEMSFDACQRQNVCFFSKTYTSALRPIQLPMYWYVLVKWVTLKEVKRPRRESHHSPPFNTEVKSS